MTHTHTKSPTFRIYTGSTRKAHPRSGKNLPENRKSDTEGKAKTIFPGQHRGRKSGNLQLRELNCFPSRAPCMLVKRKNGNVCCSMRAAKKKTSTHTQKAGKIRGKSRPRVEDENI